MKYVRIFLHEYRESFVGSRRQGFIMLAIVVVTLVLLQTITELSK